MKLIIVTVVYFLLSVTTVFAHEGEESATVVSEADWIGPLVAILIITAAIIIAKIIKKSR